MNQYRLEEIQLGQQECFSVVLTETMMNQFCEMTGDINPLHCDEEYASAKGYPGRVAYGMLVSAFYSTLAGVYLPGKNCLLQSVDIKMRLPVFIGDMLMVEGTVSEIHEELGIIRVKASISNQNGKKVSKAVLQMGVTK